MFVVVAALVVGPSARVAGQETFRTLSIAQAVAESLDRNASLLAQRSNLIVADAAIVTAGLRPNPVISGDADHLDLLGTGFDETNNAGPPEYGVRVDFPIERGKKRDLRLDVARFGRELAAAQLADATRRLKIDVLVACIDVLEAKAKLALARENLETLQELVELNQRRLTSGAIAPLEADAVACGDAAVPQQCQNLGTRRSHRQGCSLLPLLGTPAGHPPVDIDDALEVTPGADRASPERIAGHGSGETPGRSGVSHRAGAHPGGPAASARPGQNRLHASAPSTGVSRARARPRQHARLLRQRAVADLQPQPGRDRARASRAGAHQAVRRCRGLDVNTGKWLPRFGSSSRRGTCSPRSSSDLLEAVSRPRATGTTYTYQAGATSLLDVLDAQRAFNDTMDTLLHGAGRLSPRRSQLALVAGEEVPR